MSSSRWEPVRFVFGVFHLLDSRWKLRLPVLTEWGKNALLLYLLHGVLIGVFALPPAPGWYVAGASLADRIAGRGFGGRSNLDRHLLQPAWSGS